MASGDTMDQAASGNMLAESSPRTWVMRKIIQSIEKGMYVAGQPLPSTRKLSQELNTNRGTISRAFALLEEEGYLKVGENGMRIVTPRAQPVSELFAQSIAVLIRPLESRDEGHHEPGWVEFIDRAVLDGIKQAGLHAVSLNHRLINEATIANLMQSRPRGIIIGEEATYSPNTIRLLNALREAGLPVVAYGDTPELAGFDRITSDHEAGAYQLTKWLISKGCKRIVPLFNETNLENYWAQGRLSGYRRAINEAKLDIIEPAFVPVPEQVDGHESFNVRLIAGHLIEHLGPNRADAFLCVSDCYVFPAAAAARNAGWQPNKDILFVGYDNYWHEAPGRQLDPIEPAATVDKLNHVIGREMVKLLLERIDGGLPAEPQRRVVMPKMIVTEQ